MQTLMFLTPDRTKRVAKRSFVSGAVTTLSICWMLDGLERMGMNITLIPEWWRDWMSIMVGVIFLIFGLILDANSRVDEN